MGTKVIVMRSLAVSIFSLSVRLRGRDRHREAGPGTGYQSG